MTQDLNLQSLRQAAEAATPGPWSERRITDDECNLIGYEIIAHDGTEISSDDSAPSNKDALYICHANPEFNTGRAYGVAKMNAALMKLAAAAPVAQASQQPVLWYNPAKVVRDHLQGDAYMLTLAGTNTKWGEFTTPLYAAPLQQAEKDTERMDHIERHAVRGSTYKGVTSINVIVHSDDIAMGGARYAIDCMVEREQGRAIAASGNQENAK